jgi:hypothetical protein
MEYGRPREVGDFVLTGFCSGEIRIVELLEGSVATSAV